MAHVALRARAILVARVVAAWGEDVRGHYRDGGHSHAYHVSDDHARHDDRDDDDHDDDHDDDGHDDGGPPFPLDF